MLTALQYKQQGKNIQTAGYNGACMVHGTYK